MTLSDEVDELLHQVEELIEFQKDYDKFIADMEELKSQNDRNFGILDSDRYCGNLQDLRETKIGKNPIFKFTEIFSKENNATYRLEGIADQLKIKDPDDLIRRVEDFERLVRAQDKESDFHEARLKQLSEGVRLRRK